MASTSQVGMATPGQPIRYAPTEIQAQAGPSQPRSRSRSPTRGVSPTKDAKGRKEGFDLRAEEDFARRQNIGRANYVTNAPGQSRGKRTDLFGPVIRQRLSDAARDHTVSIEADVMALLTLAAEQRIRLLFSSAITASIHRSSASHLRPPPLQDSASSHADPSPSAGSGSGPRKGKAKALWKHRITSSPSAVIDALNRQAKAAEQEFRANRMDRLARETEEQRAREAAERRERLERGESGAALSSGSGAGGAAGEGDGTEDGDGDSGAAGGAGGAGGSGGGPGSSARKKQTPAKNLSAEVQHKLTNATAMRGIGVFGRKQYSWLNTPSVSSPLAGKKRKKGKGGAAAAEGGEGGAEGQVGEGEGAEIGEGSVKPDPEAGAGTGEGAGGQGAEGHGEMEIESSGQGGARPSKKPRAADGGPHSGPSETAGASDPETPLAKKKKRRTPHPLSAAGLTGGGGAPGFSPSPARQPVIPLPTRRQVLITRSTLPRPPVPVIGQPPPQQGQGPMQGQPERRVSDERAVTVEDVLFALEREGGRMGMSSYAGTAGEKDGAGGGRGVVWRARARGWEE